MLMQIWWRCLVGIITENLWLSCPSNKCAKNKVDLKGMFKGMVFLDIFSASPYCVEQGRQPRVFAFSDGPALVNLGIGV